MSEYLDSESEKCKICRCKYLRDNVKNGICAECEGDMRGDNDDFDDDGGECQCNVTGCEECDERYYENYDCGMDSSGQCGKAGSEECDWECPFSR